MFKTHYMYSESKFRRWSPLPISSTEVSDGSPKTGFIFLAFDLTTAQKTSSRVWSSSLSFLCTLDDWHWQWSSGLRLNHVGSLLAFISLLIVRSFELCRCFCVRKDGKHFFGLSWQLCGISKCCKPFELRSVHVSQKKNSCAASLISAGVDI